MISSALSAHPWAKIEADLFHLQGFTYLLLVDYMYMYFLRYMYPEVIKLQTLTASSVVTTIKGIFSRQDIPEEFVSNNGSQFNSQEFK